MTTPTYPPTGHDSVAPPVAGRVTIITAIFNAAPTLTHCIESVLNQDYPHIEHLLIDGGSTDGTLDILASYGDRITWISEPDRGIYDAWNKGIARATGEWIAFLGADDAYLPGAISAYMTACAHSDADYVSSFVRWVPAQGNPRIRGGPWQWPAFQRYMTTAHVGSLHRTSLYRRYGTYDLSYKIVGDYELLLRPCDQLRTVFVPVLTAEMQAGGISDSYRSLHEAARAKVLSGKRNPHRVRYEIIIDYIKLAARRLVNRFAVSGAS